MHVKQHPLWIHTVHSEQIGREYSLEIMPFVLSFWFSSYRKIVQNMEDCKRKLPRYG